ncbi:MAG: phosphoglycerate mutase family protein [Actinobacteria bacterium]|nr:phosphoglycerate mutase family protein [Actinomycetota bacterium]
MSAPRRVVVLRHGRTAWNDEGRIQGQLDVPLDDVGLAQAAAVAEVLAEARPYALVSSDLAARPGQPAGRRLQLQPGRGAPAVPVE